MGTAQDLMYRDHPAIIREVTASQFALQRLNPPKDPGLLYRVDGALWHWDGEQWVGQVSAASNPLTGGIGLSVGGRPDVAAAAVAAVSAGTLANLGVLRAPAGLGWNPPITFVRRGGAVQHSYTHAEFMVPTTAEMWVDVATGNDTSGTGTSAAPYKSIDKALASTSADTTIYVRAGTYNRNDCWKARSPAHNVNVIAVGGEVISSTRWEGSAYTLTTANTYAPTTARSLCASVVDLSKTGPDGVPVPMTKLASQAAVEAHDGGEYGVFFSNGTNFWVKTFDRRAPDANIIALLDIGNGRLSADRKIYVRGITFEGGGAGAFSNVDGTMAAAARQVFDQCVFRWSSAQDTAVGNGLTVVGCALTICHACVAYGNRADGFNYHKGATNTIDARFVEIDCVSFGNGLADGAGNDNATTAHEDARGVRLRTVAKGSHGPLYADINTSKTWNIDCVSLGSAGDPATYSTTGFLTLDTAVQYLDGCYHELAPGMVGTAAYTGATAAQYARNSVLPGITLPTF